MFHKRRERFKFTEKRHSVKGMVTLGIAAALAVLLLLFLFFSYRTNGALSLYYGSAGVLAMLCAAANVMFSVQSLFEENSFQLFPRISVVLSLAAAAGWIGIYVTGF